MSFHDATAQKIMSSSAWRTETLFTDIPAHTKIRVRTAEAIGAQCSEGQTFQGIVANEVIGGSGNILVNKGANVLLVVRRLPEDRLALDLQSVETNGEQFGAAPSNETVPVACVSSGGTMTGEAIEVPAGSVLTFRLAEPFQAIGETNVERTAQR